MTGNLEKLFDSHSEWIQSEGEDGEQLSLERITSSSDIPTRVLIHAKAAPVLSNMEVSEYLLP